MSATKRGRALTAVISTTKLVIVTVVVLLAVQILLHRRYRRWIAAGHLGTMELADQSRLTGLPLDLIRDVGSFTADPEHEALRAPTPPPADTIRIATFGDSFTFGDEVPHAHSFPRQLADRFAREGLANVEVLNFGNSWHGLAQQHRLWDLYARRFAPDFLLVGPGAQYADRDESFHHGERIATGYLHGRAVLDDSGGTVFVSPTGETLIERVDRYFGLLPRARYLSFDRSPPPFIRAWLPREKTIRNPFYYTRLSDGDERTRLYRALIADMSRDDDVVVTSLSEWFSIDLSGVGGHFVRRTLPRLDDFALVRPRGHYSSIGNRLIADLYFDALSGAKETTLHWLTLLGAPPRAPAPSRKPISAYHRAQLSIGGVVVGTITKQADTGMRCDDRQEAVDFAATKVVSLLVVADTNDFPLNFPMAPLTKPIAVGERPVLELRTAKGTRRIELSPIELVGPEVEIGVTRLKEAVHGPNRFFGTELGALGADVLSGELFVNGSPVLRLNGEKHLVPIEGELFAATATCEARIDARAIAREGVIELTLDQDGAPPLRIEVGRYAWKDISLPFDGPGLRRRIARDGSGAVVVNR